MKLFSFAKVNAVVRRIGALAALAGLWQTFLQPQTPTTEYIRGGGRVIAAVHTPPAYFTDMTGSYAPFLNYANLLKADGISSGTGPNTFSPSLTLTRDNAAVLVIRTIYVALLGPGQGDSFTYSSTAYFSDVSNTYPYFKWIQKMYELGITGGCGGGNYCPTTAVTNAGMAVFTIRGRQIVLTGGTSFSYPSTPQYYADEPGSDTYFSWVQEIGYLNIVPPAAGSFGCSTTNYCGSSSINRGPATAFVIRGILNDWSF